MDKKALTDILFKNIKWPICPENGSTVSYEKIDANGKVIKHGRNKIYGIYIFYACIIDGKRYITYDGATFHNSDFGEREIWLVNEYVPIVLVEKIWKNGYNRDITI